MKLIFSVKVIIFSVQSHNLLNQTNYNLTFVNSKKGMTDLAISLLKQSIELDALFPEPYSALASLYAENHRIEEAELLHRKALELDPENADFLNNYGAFLQKIGKNKCDKMPKRISQFNQSTFYSIIKVLEC